MPTAAQSSDCLEGKAGELDPGDLTPDLGWDPDERIWDLYRRLITERAASGVRRGAAAELGARPGADGGRGSPERSGGSPLDGGGAARGGNGCCYS